MSPEKTRWFTPQNKNRMETLPIPSPILNTSQLSAAELATFRQLLESNRQSLLTDVSWTIFHNLLEMPPRARLVRNLKVLLDQMMKGPIESIMRDGLQPRELEALQALERMDIGVDAKMIAQALLNVYERYQLSLALASAFA
jgi:hypothetical protein